MYFHRTCISPSFLRNSSFSVFLYLFLLFLLSSSCPRCSSRHCRLLFPHFSSKPPHFPQKLPAIKGNPSKSPLLLPRNSPKLYFPSLTPLKTPVFNKAPAFPIKCLLFFPPFLETLVFY